MKHRAERKDVYRQVKIDTKEVCKQYGFKPDVVEVCSDTANISSSILSTIKDFNMEFARDKEEVKDALLLVEGDDDAFLCIKHWMGRLLLSGKTLGNHSYTREEPKLRNLSLLFGYDTKPEIRATLTLEARLTVEMFDDGRLYVRLHVEAWNDETQNRPTLYFNSWSGKPSRVLRKIFGEKFTTYMCQHYPIKSNKCELHFSRHYIPELYHYIAEDENQTSCMSKDSDDYGLPDTHHPVMAYEGSPNAALALLWDTVKKRYVARAITHLDGMKFDTAYGVSGCLNKFKQAGLSRTGDLEGMKIAKHYYGDELLVPYVDGDTQKLRHSDCGNYLVVDDCGDVEGSYETGREVSTRECPCCGERYTEEGESTEDGEVCASCSENYYRWVDSERQLVHEDHLVYDDWVDEYYRDDVAMVSVSVQGRMWGMDYHIMEDNFQHFLENYPGTIKSIDGVDYYEWLLEQEEAA